MGFLKVKPTSTDVGLIYGVPLAPVSRVGEGKHEKGHIHHHRSIIDIGQREKSWLTPAIVARPRWRNGAGSASNLSSASLDNGAAARAGPVMHAGEERLPA